MSGRRKNIKPCVVRMAKLQEPRNQQQEKKEQKEKEKEKQQKIKQKEEEKQQEMKQQEEKKEDEKQQEEKQDHEEKEVEVKAKQEELKEMEEEKNQQHEKEQEKEVEKEMEQEEKEEKEEQEEKGEEHGEKEEVMEEEEEKEEQSTDSIALQTDQDSTEKDQSDSCESDDKIEEEKQNCGAEREEQQEEEEQEDEEKENQEQEEGEKENQEQEEGEKENQSPDAAQSKEFECKYCGFSASVLSGLQEHVDTSHPHVIMNPVYLCVCCSFTTRKFDLLMEHNDQAHPRDATFKYRKSSEDGVTLLQQTIEDEETEEMEERKETEDRKETEEKEQKEEREEETEKREEKEGRKENKEEETEEKEEVSVEAASISPEGLLTPGGAKVPPEQIRAVSINGTVLIPEGSVLHDSCHVSPMLQRPPNFSCVPQIAVPLNTSKYNPSLDHSATLMASFNRFPYPTQAELSWLTAASKHPEEQIRVWFTTQRLKQGITWSPEEVEEARKKMFNGSIPPNHNAFTALPTALPNTLPTALPISKATSLTTTVETRNGASHSVSNGLKRILNSAFGPEAKRPVMAVAPNHGEKGLMAPPPLPPPLQKPADTKRANANDARRPMPLLQSLQTPLKNKMVPNVPSNSKTKPVVSMPSIVFPESLTRPMIAPPPIFASPFKNTILVPRTTKDKPAITLPNGVLPSSAPLIPPQIRRPAVIQTLRANQSAPQGYGPEVAASEQSGGDALKPAFTAAWPEPVLQSNGRVEEKFPLLERLKGKSSEQLKVLEENFMRNSFPSHSEVESLASATRLSLPEVQSWFGERRALRDNLEQALLNSMGTKRTGSHGNGVIGNGLHGNGVIGNGLHGNGLHGNSLHGNGLHSNGLHNNGLHNNGLHNNGSLYGPEKHNGLKGGHLGYSLNRVPEEFVSRWSFADDLSQRWFNGKTGSVLPSSDLIGPRCQDLTNGSNGRAQEAELNWFNKNLSPPQQDHFRFRPALDLQAGGVYGRWMDRRPDLSEDLSG